MYEQQAKVQSAQIYGRGLEPAADVGGRQLEIPHQMDALGRNLDGLSEIIASMEVRLEGSIARPENSNKAGGEPRPVPSVKLAGELEAANDALVSMRCRIESLLARMEV